jgi:opacity protein-like surface antigen
MKTISLSLLILCLLASPTKAQLPRVAGTGPLVEAGIGYSYVNLAIPQSSRINLSGLDATMSVDFFPRFGVTADLGYVRAANVLHSVHHSDVLSYLGGPVFYPQRGRKQVIYVRGLLGGARVTGVVPLIPVSDGELTGYANKLAWAVGGGFEYRLTGSIGIQAGADFMHTSFFDSSSRVRGQSNFRSVISILYYLGRGSRRSPM